MEMVLRAHDDGPRVLILTRRAVSYDTQGTPGFSARRLTVLSSCSLLSRPGSLLAAAVAVGNWETLQRFPSVSVFSTAILYGCPQTAS